MATNPTKVAMVKKYKSAPMGVRLVSGLSTKRHPHHQPLQLRQSGGFFHAVLPVRRRRRSGSNHCAQNMSAASLSKRMPSVCGVNLQALVLRKGQSHHAWRLESFRQEEMAQILPWPPRERFGVPINCGRCLLRWFTLDGCGRLPLASSICHVMVMLIKACSHIMVIMGHCGCDVMRARCQKREPVCHSARTPQHSSLRRVRRLTLRREKEKVNLCALTETPLTTPAKVARLLCTGVTL